MYMNEYTYICIYAHVCVCIRRKPVGCRSFLTKTPRDPVTSFLEKGPGSQTAALKIQVSNFLLILSRE